MILFALEPGVEVDIEATCGGLGRALTGRDRRRLWRRVREWEVLQARRTLARYWRDPGKRRRQGSVENGTDSSPVTRTASKAEDGGMFDEKPG